MSTTDPVRIQGLAGAFLYATDCDALAAWYQRVLGIETQKYGKAWFVEWPGADIHPGGTRLRTVTFAIFDGEGPVAETKTARLGFRVPDLDAAIAAIEARGVEVIRKPEADDYGRFAWLFDPEGNKLELWEPPPLGTEPPPV